MGSGRQDEDEASGPPSLFEKQGENDTRAFPIARKPLTAPLYTLRTTGRPAPSAKRKPSLTRGELKGTALLACT